MNTTGPVHENYNFYIDLNKGMRLILAEIFLAEVVGTEKFIAHMSIVIHSRFRYNRKTGLHLQRSLYPRSSFLGGNYTGDIGTGPR